MSTSDQSDKLNNCVTCEQIKSSQLDNEYSSDYEEETLFSDSAGSHENVETLRLDFNQSKLDKSRNSSAIQQNKTFSPAKIREIERRNAMLVNRILYHDRRPNQYKSTVASLPKVTSAEINRRRHQEKIVRENEILLKKIQSVKPAVRYHP